MYGEIVLTRRAVIAVKMPAERCTSNGELIGGPTVNDRVWPEWKGKVVLTYQLRLDLGRGGPDDNLRDTNVSKNLRNWRGASPRGVVQGPCALHAV
jgi:hypothetical protein